MLRGMVWLQREEVTGGGINWRNKERHDLYRSPDIIRAIKSMKMRWARHVARIGQKRALHRFLVVKPEGKRTLGRPKIR